MARHAPKDTLNQILHMTQAWESLRPTKSFAGLSLAQFKKAVQPSQNVRAEIVDLENRLRAVCRDGLPAQERP